MNTAVPTSARRWLGPGRWPGGGGRALGGGRAPGGGRALGGGQHFLGSGHSVGDQCGKQLWQSQGTREVETLRITELSDFLFSHFF